MGVAARERHRRPAAGDEARDDDQVEAAHLELALGPFERAPALLAAEQRLTLLLAEPAAEAVRDVVADDRAEAAQTITSGRLRSPAPATTPAVITTVSLGTSGKNASSIETAKTTGYVHQAPDTHWTN